MSQDEISITFAGSVYYSEERYKKPMPAIDQVMADTLAMVNTARRAFGIDPLAELPSSAPGQASDCLFARALRPIGVVSVSSRGGMRFDDARKAATAASVWGVDVVEGGVVVSAPAEFEEVISQFDGRKLPFVDSNA